MRLPEDVLYLVWKKFNSMFVMPLLEQRTRFLPILGCCNMVRTDAEWEASRSIASWLFVFVYSFNPALMSQGNPFYEEYKKNVDYYEWIGEIVIDVDDWKGTGVDVAQLECELVNLFPCVEKSADGKRLRAVVGADGDWIWREWSMLVCAQGIKCGPMVWRRVHLKTKDDGTLVYVVDLDGRVGMRMLRLDIERQCARPVLLYDRQNIIPWLLWG